MSSAALLCWVLLSLLGVSFSFSARSAVSLIGIPCTGKFKARLDSKLSRWQQTSTCQQNTVREALYSQDDHWHVIVRVTGSSLSQPYTRVSRNGIACISASSICKQCCASLVPLKCRSLGTLAAVLVTAVQCQLYRLCLTGAELGIGLQTVVRPVAHSDSGAYLSPSIQHL